MNMQIVIDIPEGAYEEICRARFPIQDGSRLVSWIKDGTPLPKGYEKYNSNAYANANVPTNSVKREAVVDLFIKDLMILQTICERGMTCSKCSFDTKDEGCALNDVPMKWRLDKLYNLKTEKKLNE